MGGLTDVMDIVHKFLNRANEHDQLKSSVKDAEVHLEALRQEFDAKKEQTEGFAFDQPAARERAIFVEKEEAERVLECAMDEHQAARVKLQRSTLQVEHMVRWASDMGDKMKSIDEPAEVKSPADLAKFFKRLYETIEKFMGKVQGQLEEGKINRRLLTNDAKKEREWQKDRLTDQTFLANNCRVPAFDPGSTSRPGSAEDYNRQTYEHLEHLRQVQRQADLEAAQDKEKKNKQVTQDKDKKKGGGR